MYSFWVAEDADWVRANVKQQLAKFDVKKILKNAEQYGFTYTTRQGDHLI